MKYQALFSLKIKKDMSSAAVVIGTLVVNQGDVTVDSEIFARVLFSRNFAYAKFRENKILAKPRNHSVIY